MVLKNGLWSSSRLGICRSNTRIANEFECANPCPLALWRRTRNLQFHGSCGATRILVPTFVGTGLRRVPARLNNVSRSGGLLYPKVIVRRQGFHGGTDQTTTLDHQNNREGSDTRQKKSRRAAGFEIYAADGASYRKSPVAVNVGTPCASITAVTVFAAFCEETPRIVTVAPVFAVTE